MDNFNKLNIVAHGKAQKAPKSWWEIYGVIKEIKPYQQFEYNLIAGVPGEKP